MIVYHSYFSPLGATALAPTIIAYVDAEAGVPDSLEAALYDFAAHHGTDVLVRGHYHVPGFGYFWTEGRYPGFEKHAREHEGGVLHGAEAMKAHYRSKQPIGVVRSGVAWAG